MIIEAVNSTDYDDFRVGLDEIDDLNEVEADEKDVPCSDDMYALLMSVFQNSIPDSLHSKSSSSFLGTVTPQKIACTFEATVQDISLEVIEKWVVMLRKVKAEAFEAALKSIFIATIIRAQVVYQNALKTAEISALRV